MEFGTQAVEGTTSLHTRTEAVEKAVLILSFDESEVSGSRWGSGGSRWGSGGSGGGPEGI
eukprot:1176958-Prorocentrum_minimum.AAC.1